MDFIKLDVPEFKKALLGANRTIQTYRPILAISLAQAERDVVAMQPFLEQMEDDYSFFLDHFFAGSHGIVLFCRPRCPRP